MPVNLGTAQGEINISTRGVDQAERVVGVKSRQMTQSLERVGQGVGGLQKRFGALNQFLGLGFLLGTATGVSRGILSLAAAASDLDESINKVGVAFGSSTYQILRWSETSAKALGQSRKQALEGASSFGLLFGTMGVGAEKSAEMSIALVQLATDMASINNISTEEALTKLRSGLVGEVEPLRTVGILLNSTVVEAKALEMGLAGTSKALTEQHKVLARYALVMEQSALTHGDFSNTIEGLANQQRISEGTASDAAAAFGKMVQPDVLYFTKEWTATLVNLTEWIANARAALGGGDKPGGGLYEQLLRFGGWKTADEQAADKAGKKAENLRGLLVYTERELSRLQARGEAGVLNEAAINRQIERVAELKREIAALDVIAARPRNLMLEAVGVYTRNSYMGGGSGVGGGAVTPRFTPEEEAAQVDAKISRYTSLQAIDKSAGEARVSATRQYEEQRANVIREYGKSMAREAEDFARSRVRAEADHLASLAGLRQNAARREANMAEELARVNQEAGADSAERVADWQKDYNKAIAEARSEGNKRLEDLEADYNKERLRAAEDSRDSLMDAAGRLDAVAVRQEQDRFAKDNRRAAEAHAERVADEHDALEEVLDNLNKAHAERLADEAKTLAKSTRQRQEAYDRQLKDGRENDASREADLVKDFEARKALEDEDRATRLSRAAADYQDGLDEAARQHALNLAQMETNAVEARAQVEEDFNKAMDEAGIRNEKWIAQNEKLTDAAIRDYDRATEAIARSAAALLAAAVAAGGSPIDQMMRDDGMGGAAASRGSTITVERGAIVIYGAVGQDEEKIGDIAERRLIRVLEEAV